MQGRRASVLLLVALLGACVPGPRVEPEPRTVPQPQGATLPPRAVVLSPRATPPLLPSMVTRGADRPAPWLDQAIGDAWSAFPGRTGVAVRRIDGNWSLSRRGGELFPQQSVSKLWVTLAVLDAVDQGRLRLDQPVRITADDLTLFNQPIAARVRRDGAVTETVASLISMAITKSDNTANDSLLRTVGGPDAVRAFIASRKLGAVRFGPGERAMQSRIAGISWSQNLSVGDGFYAARNAVSPENRRRALDAYLADPVDGASPDAIVAALDRLARGELLSPVTTRLALDTMARTTSGPQRLKAGLPPGWRIAHKTGTGQVLGATGTGYNDIAVVTAPDGTRYAIAVMMASTTASIPQRMAFMQTISRLVAQAHMP